MLTLYLVGVKCVLPLEEQMFPKGNMHLIIYTLNINWFYHTVPLMYTLKKKIYGS